MLRKVITVRIYLLWDVREGSWERNTMEEEKLVGWRGQRGKGMRWWELQVRRWRGTLCVWGPEEARLVWEEQGGTRWGLRGTPGWTWEVQAFKLFILLLCCGCFLWKDDFLLFLPLPLVRKTLKMAAFKNQFGHMGWKASKCSIFLLSRLCSKWPLEFPVLYAGNKEECKIQ